MDSENIYHGMSRVKLRPWRELAALTLITMELSWLSAWYLQLVHDPRGLSLPGIYALLGMLILVVYWFTRLMLSLKLRTQVRRLILASLLLAGYVLLLRWLIYPSEQITLARIGANLQSAFRDPQRPIPVEFTLFLLAAYVWYRGTALASSWIGVYLVRRTFQYGVLSFLLLGVVSSFMPSAPILPTVIVFLTSGFVAMGAARASTLKMLRGAGRLGFSNAWLLSVVVLAIVVVQSALAIGGVASARLPALLIFIVVLLMRVLLIIGAVLASPILLILALIFPWLEQRLTSAPIVAAIEEEIRALFQFVIGVFATLSGLLRDFYLALPDLSGAKAYMLWTGIMVVFIVLVWVGGRFTLPRLRAGRAGIEEQRQSDQGAPRAWVRKLFQNGLNRLYGRFSLRERTGYFGALRIRRIYTQLSRLCAGLQVPRPETSTPLEYLEELELLFPEEQSEVRTITHAYNRIRYGEFPETADEVRQVERAWRQVRQRASDLQETRKQLAEE